MNANFESHSISRRSFLKASGVVGAASILAACGGSSSSTAASTSGAASGAAAPAADAITDYVSFETANRELETWNFLYSQSASDLNVTTNCWDGLLSFDCYGKAVPAIASSWEHNEDSTVWTFHLRDNVDWCDVNGEVKSHLTSKDFLVGLEWVLNALKNEAFNTSMPSETVVGAAEYYDLTKDKGDAAADMTYEDMLAAGVGVEAPDDYTLVFTCKNPCPYFDTVAAYNSFYPASEDLIKELGIDGFRSCDYSTMWYNGPYLIEEYIQQNTKSFIPNPNYYAANDCTRFEHHTITMIPDLSMGLQLYENGEVDNIDLTESNLTTITSDPNNKHNKFLCEKRPTKFSFQMHLNFQRKDENGNLDENWNKAVSNRAFRQCFYKGIDFTNYYARTNKINPLKCENDYYTMPGVCYNTKGEEYTTLVAKEMGFDSQAYDGKTMIRLRDNGGDIADLKKQAMEELSAIGVTFPVHCYHYIKSGDTTALDTATVLKQCFSESLGDDFVVLDIGTYVSSLYKEVRNVQLHSILQGHPDAKKVPGVDAATGSLGQGCSIAVGMAQGAKVQHKDCKVYTLLGDGECQEGQIWESFMAAAHYHLDNLTIIIDNNGLQIDGTNDEVMSLGDLPAKLRAFGLDLHEIDGHDMDTIEAALSAPAVPGKPKCILAHTVKGKGVSFMENQVGWHGKAPNEEQRQQALKELED